MQREQVTQAINAVLPDYLTRVEYPYDINCGLCEDFARDVIEKLGGYTDELDYVWVEDIENTPAPDGAHCVIYLRCEGSTFYFDAEIPEGTNDLTQIPVIKNAEKSRAEVIQLLTTV